MIAIWIEKEKTFFVGDTADSQIYVIPDVTMDTTTIRVRVFDTAVSSTFDTYTNINTATRITSTSTHYQIKEVPNGYYEIIFGDGISTGKAPSAGNMIVIDYLSIRKNRIDFNRFKNFKYIIKVLNNPLFLIFDLPSHIIFK